MRELLRLCPAILLIVGCGFDPTTPAIPSGGSSGSPTAGTAPVGGNLNDMTNGGSNAGTGPMAGTGGVVTPMGGNGGGGAGSAGSPMGGAGAGMGGAGMGGMNGGAGMGGAGGAGGTSNIDPHFKLAWRDDFDSFSDARWTKQSHTFDENLARFSPNNVVVEGGFLKLKVTHQTNQDKPYTAAEVASKDLFTFGRFAGRIKFCAGSGMVSSLFTYKDNVNQSWQEIDIEHLGNLSKSIQYNLITGNLANRVYQPKVVNFPWSPPADFHEYVIEWRPENITFFIDGQQTHQAVQAALKDAARLHMNAWPTDNAHTSFAGTFDPNAVPCEADYDWIEAYTYTP